MVWDSLQFQLMSKYLGGIIAVNEGKLLPEEAEEIASVEYPDWSVKQPDYII